MTRIDDFPILRFDSKPKSRNVNLDFRRGSSTHPRGAESCASSGVPFRRSQGMEMAVLSKASGEEPGPRSGSPPGEAEEV